LRICAPAKGQEGIGNAGEGDEAAEGDGHDLPDGSSLVQGIVSLVCTWFKIWVEGDEAAEGNGHSLPDTE
jgi:hypothetical protein